MAKDFWISPLLLLAHLLSVPVTNAVVVVDSSVLSFSEAAPDQLQVWSINITTSLFPGQGTRPFFMVGSYYDANAGCIESVCHKCSGASVPSERMHFLPGETLPLAAIADTSILTNGLAGPPPVHEQVPQWTYAATNGKYFDLHDCNDVLGGQLPEQSNAQSDRGRKLVYAITVDPDANTITYYIKYHLPSFAQDYAHRGVVVEQLHGANGLLSGHRYHFQLSFIVLGLGGSQGNPIAWSKNFAVTVQTTGDVTQGIVTGQSGQCPNNPLVHPQSSVESYPFAECFEEGAEQVGNNTGLPECTQARLHITFRLTFNSVPQGTSIGLPIYIDTETGEPRVNTSAIHIPADIVECSGLEIVEVLPAPETAPDFCLGDQCYFLVRVRTAFFPLTEDGEAFLHCLPGHENGRERNYTLVIEPVSQCDREPQHRACEIECEALCDRSVFTFDIHFLKWPRDNLFSAYRAVGASRHRPLFLSGEGDPPLTEDEALQQLACHFDDVPICHDEQCVTYDTCPGNPNPPFPPEPPGSGDPDMCFYYVMQDRRLWDLHPFALFVLMDTLQLVDQQDGFTVSLANLGPAQWSQLLALLHRVPRQIFLNYDSTADSGQGGPLNTQGGSITYPPPHTTPMLHAAQQHRGVDGFCFRSSEYLDFYHTVNPNSQGNPNARSIQASVRYHYNISANATKQLIISPNTLARRRLLQFEDGDVTLVLPSGWWESTGLTIDFSTTSITSADGLTQMRSGHATIVPTGGGSGGPSDPWAYHGGGGGGSYHHSSSSNSSSDQTTAWVIAGVAIFLVVVIGICLVVAAGSPPGTWNNPAYYGESPQVHADRVAAERAAASAAASAQFASASASARQPLLQQAQPHLAEMYDTRDLGDVVPVYNGGVAYGDRERSSVGERKSLLSGTRSSGAARRHKY